MAIILPLFESSVHTTTQLATHTAHLPSAPLHSGFSSQLSHSVGLDMKADQIQLALPPEMILLIRISSGAGNTQHLPLPPGWQCAEGNKQCLGASPSPSLTLHSTCYMRHLDCAEFRLAASWMSLWESQHVTQAPSRDALIINHPLNTHLLIVRSFFSGFHFHLFMLWSILNVVRCVNL